MKTYVWYHNSVTLKMAVIIKDLWIGIQVIDLRRYLQEFSIKMRNLVYLVK